MQKILLNRVCIYLTSPPRTGILFKSSMYLPNPSATDRDSFLNRVCIYPTPPPRTGILFESSMYLPNPSATDRVWQMNNFKAGLNSVFNFYEFGCLTKAQEISLYFYLPIVGRRTYVFMPLPSAIVRSETLQPRPGLELGSPIPFSTTKTITQSAPLLISSN